MVFVFFLEGGLWGDGVCCQVSDQRVVAIVNEDGILLIDPTSAAKVRRQKLSLLVVGVMCAGFREQQELSRWRVSVFRGRTCRL